MTQMKWHAEIKHMADHGFASVERHAFATGSYIGIARDDCNPVTHPHFDWRIKPAKLRINVEILKPDGGETDWPVQIGMRSVAYYKTEVDFYEAERLLVAALLGEI